MDSKARSGILFLVVTSIVLYSCVDTKSATYFNGLKNKEILYQAESLEPVIQKNDLLSIVVSSLNAEATAPFNLYAVSSSPGGVNSGTVTQAAGFLVDQEGNIQFPMLGTIKAAGITKKQLKETIVRGF